MANNLFIGQSLVWQRFAATLLAVAMVGCDTVGIRGDGATTTLQTPRARRESSAADERGLAAFRYEVDAAAAREESDALRERGASEQPEGSPARSKDTTTSRTSETDHQDAAERRVVYTAAFEILVANVKDAMQQHLHEIKSLGGHFQSRNASTIVSRVPAANFEKLVETIPSLGRVLSESVDAMDVTKRYFDLELRIRTTENALERLVVLLKKSEKVEDLLKIEEQIRRLTEELERLKAELRQLADRVAYSTLTVTFHSSAPPPQPPGVRVPNRFEWINHVGIEYVIDQF